MYSYIREWKTIHQYILSYTGMWGIYCYILKWKYVIKVYTNTTIHILEYVLYILVYHSIYYIQPSYTVLYYALVYGGIGCLSFVYQGLYETACSYLSVTGHSGGVRILKEVTYTAVYLPMLYNVIIFGTACLGNTSLLLESWHLSYVLIGPVIRKQERQHGSIAVQTLIYK